MFKKLLKKIFHTSHGAPIYDSRRKRRSEPFSHTHTLLDFTIFTHTHPVMKDKNTSLHILYLPEKKRMRFPRFFLEKKSRIRIYSVTVTTTELRAWVCPREKRK